MRGDLVALARVEVLEGADGLLAVRVDALLEQGLALVLPAEGDEAALDGVKRAREAHARLTGVIRRCF